MPAGPPPSTTTSNSPCTGTSRAGSVSVMTADGVTGPAPRAPRSTQGHVQRPQPGDLAVHPVAANDRGHAFGRAGHDQVSGGEFPGRRQVRDDLGDAP